MAAYAPGLLACNSWPVYLRCLSYSERCLAQFELLGLLELVVSLEVLTYLRCLSSLICLIYMRFLVSVWLFGLLAIELRCLV